MGPLEKRSVYNVSKLVVSKGMETIEVRGNDWEPTLKKRGFEQMVADFVQAVTTGSKVSIAASDALETHKICERILTKLGRNQ
jgi:virulence factor